MEKVKKDRAWNSTLPQRKKPLQAKKGLQGGSTLKRGNSQLKRTPLNKRGKKTKAWEACRAGLKPRFERAGIITCEARRPDCWHDNGLGFAHSKKRRNIGPGELEEVILCCNHCHDRIEAWPEAEMTQFVRDVISRRRVKV